MADELRYHMAVLARAAIGQDWFIELASAAGPDGRSVRICTWPGSSLIIGLAGNRAMLRDSAQLHSRTRGPGVLSVGREEIRNILAALQHWFRVEAEFASFETASGCGGQTYYYRPPGIGAKKTRVGERRGGFRSGVTFKESWVRVAKEPPLAVAPGVSIAGEDWRLGELVGPPEGSKVGLLYRIEPDLSLQCGEGGPLLFREDGSELRISPDSRALFEALIQVLESDSGGDIGPSRAV